jgi:hypothetical protein
MTTRKADSLAQIETEARRMARTGIYPGFREIAARLRVRGYVEAPKVFANPWTQHEIDRLCDMSRIEPVGQLMNPVSKQVHQQHARYCSTRIYLVGKKKRPRPNEAEPLMALNNPSKEASLRDGSITGIVNQKNKAAMRGTGSRHSSSVIVIDGVSPFRFPGVAVCFEANAFSRAPVKNRTQ